MACATQKKDAITGDVALHCVLHKDDNLVRLVEHELAEFREAFSAVCGEDGHFFPGTVTAVDYDELPTTGEVLICTARYNSGEANYELSVLESRGYALRNDPFRKVDGIKLRFVVRTIE